MKSLTRRDALAGTAAVVGASAIVSPVVASSQARQLWEKYTQAKSAYIDACFALDSAESDARDECEKPWTGFCPTWGRRGVGITLYKGSAWSLKRAGEEFVEMPGIMKGENSFAPARALMDRRNAEIEKRNEAVFRRHGVPRLIAELQKAGAHMRTIRDEILALRGCSHEVLLVKLALWEVYQEFNDEFPPDEWESGPHTAYSDLRELIGFDPVADYRKVMRGGAS